MKIYEGKIEYTIVLNFAVNADSEEKAMEIAEKSSSFRPEFITNKEITRSIELEHDIGFISNITPKQQCKGE